jgi:predicted fused transcriptional regulator/phosphomethylpyrimidine kinase
MSLRIGSDICLLHKKSIPSLDAEDCSICSELLSGADTHLTSKSKTLQDIQEALEYIHSSSTFANLVPEVRANLVSCARDAESVEDVAGIPGRITAVEGKAKAFLPPRFGASKHTASLLLLIREKWTGYQACLCLSGKEHVVSAIGKTKIKLISLTSSTSEPSEIAGKAFNDSVRKPRGFLGIHVPGGIGLEPILYIFGTSAVDLSVLAEEIGLILSCEN